MKEKTARRNTFVLGTLLVAAVYALPTVAVYTGHGGPMHISVFDDTYYGMRVVDVARGGSLGNPFLLENQDALHFLPELSEQALGGLARISGISPLTVLATARILFPAAIFSLTLRVALDLGLLLPWALVAAALPPLAPSLGHLSISGTAIGDTNFLRYMRSISPATHVFFFLLFLALLIAVRRRAAFGWTPGCVASTLAAGVALALLTGTPMYYWTTAYVGVMLLAATSLGGSRRVTLLVLLIGLLAGGPQILHSLRVLQDPQVADTISGLGLLTRGRELEPGALTRFAASWPPILVLAFRRRSSGMAASFLLPFLVPTAFFFLQSVITGTQVQAYHWANPMIPLWSISLGLAGQELAPRFLPTAASGVLAMTLLAIGGTLTQAASMPLWERSYREVPELMAPNLSMPRTLRWLNDYTPPNSVVLSSDAGMEALPLFCHNKVFRSYYMNISGSARILRDQYALHGPPDFLRPAPYRLDYYLGTGPMCRQLPPQRTVFEDASEQTCIWSFIRERDRIFP